MAIVSGATAICQYCDIGFYGASPYYQLPPPPPFHYNTPVYDVPSYSTPSPPALRNNEIPERRAAPSQRLKAGFNSGL